MMEEELERHGRQGTWGSDTQPSSDLFSCRVEWGENSSVTRDFKGETKLRERCVQRDHWCERRKGIVFAFTRFVQNAL